MSHRGIARARSRFLGRGSMSSRAQGLGHTGRQNAVRKGGYDNDNPSMKGDAPSKRARTSAADADDYGGQEVQSRHFDTDLGDKDTAMPTIETDDPGFEMEYSDLSDDLSDSGDSHEPRAGTVCTTTVDDTNRGPRYRAALHVMQVIITKC
jgi:hypothetical protein